MGGTTPDTHGRPHGLRPQGRPSPQDVALWGTTLLGSCSQLLGDSLWWSDHDLDCSALVRTCSDKLKTTLHNGYKALGD